MVVVSAWCVLLSAIGCGEDEDIGKGMLGVEIWGEEFIESGIPANELADGWAINFNRFLINVGSITIAEDGDEPALNESGYRVYDLAATSGPELIVQIEAPAVTYDETYYRVVAATSASVAGNATEQDVQLMINSSYSVFVEGTANDATETVAFAWGFDNTTAYGPCQSTAVLEKGAAASVQITIHGDHLFYDDAVSDEPSLRFADIALADSDQNGEVSVAELEAYGISTLPNYGVGNLDIDSLWDYIEHMTTTLGHIDGEGHCHI
jgi:hypothetical protein